MWLYTNIYIYVLFMYIYIFFNADIPIISLAHLLEHTQVNTVCCLHWNRQSWYFFSRGDSWAYLLNVRILLWQSLIFIDHQSHAVLSLSLEKRLARRFRRVWKQLIVPTKHCCCFCCREPTGWQQEFKRLLVKSQFLRNVKVVCNCNACTH